MQSGATLLPSLRPGSQDSDEQIISCPHSFSGLQRYPQTSRLRRASGIGKQSDLPGQGLATLLWEVPDGKRLGLCRDGSARLSRYGANEAREGRGTNERAPRAPAKLLLQTPVAAGCGPQASVPTPARVERQESGRESSTCSSQTYRPGSRVRHMLPCTPGFPAGRSTRPGPCLRTLRRGSRA